MTFRSLVCAAALCVGVHGHGYVKVPASRNYACQQGANTGCGAVQYEPQSVEGPDRYPGSGPADGTLAAAGSDTWAQLNEQSATRWAKTGVSGGEMDFTWQFTANHVSKDWRYFITKLGWDVNAPLARDTFEMLPFCEADGNGVKPPMVLTHTCTVPHRTGYHIVLAIWDVADTAASFYNAVDLDFDGSSNPVPTPPVPTPPVPTPPVPTPPVPTPPVPTPPVPTPPVPPTPCTQQPILEWGSCLHAPSCCSGGSSCYQQSQWYAQCRITCDVPSMCKKIG